MSAIKSIKLINFRNFSELKFDFNRHLNILIGENGCGKTSILEAIYLLSTGRSFRTNNLLKTMKINAYQMAINCQLTINDRVVSVIDYKRVAKQDRVLLLNDKSAKSMAEVAAMIPVCSIDGSSFRALSSSSQYRRKLLDWGLFHVKPEFISTWKQYNIILKQRNSLLKSTKNTAFYNTWDQMFIKAAIELNKLRQEYFNLIEPLFASFINLLLPTFIEKDQKVRIKFEHGFGALNKNSDNIDEFKLACSEKLRQSLVDDIERGYTSIGPHRADILFKVNNHNAKDVLSRGQEKVAIIAFYLAQLALISSQGEKNCIVLLDDLAAELDKQSVSRLFNELLKSTHQLILSVIDKDHLPTSVLSLVNEDHAINSSEKIGKGAIKLFHVEQFKDKN